VFRFPIETETKFYHHFFPCREHLDHASHLLDKTIAIHNIICRWKHEAFSFLRCIKFQLIRA